MSFIAKQSTTITSAWFTAIVIKVLTGVELVIPKLVVVIAGEPLCFDGKGLAAFSSQDNSKNIFLGDRVVGINSQKLIILHIFKIYKEFGNNLKGQETVW